jgi:hypothetical protein
MTNRSVNPTLPSLQFGKIIVTNQCQKSQVATRTGLHRHGQQKQEPLPAPYAATLE